MALMQSFGAEEGGSETQGETKRTHTALLPRNALGGISRPYGVFRYQSGRRVDYFRIGGHTGVIVHFPLADSLVDK
jgi:hypothetical protein